MQGLRGFTLLEMIMVLVITGIVLLVVAPKWSKYLTYWEMEAETRKMVARIRATREKAMHDLTPYRMVFNVTDERYLVEKYDGWSPWYPDPSDNEREVVIQSGAVDLNDTNLDAHILIFDEFGAVSGSISPDSEGRIYLQDPWRMRTIHINNVTGSVWVQ